MKLDWLEDFIVLSEEGSFSRTARRRNVAQPALSRRIRALESWAGTELFDRQRHPVSLTEQGRLFQPFAEDAMRSIRQGRNKLQSNKQDDKILKFSSTHTISILFFPDWFRSIHAELGGTGISLQANHLEHCVKELENGSCHFMLCYSDGTELLGFDERSFECKCVGRDELIPVSMVDSLRQPKYTLPGKSTDPNPLLEYSPASALGRMVEALLTRKREHPRVQKQSESPAADNLLALASQGLGIAWIPGLRLKGIDGDEYPDLARAGDRSWNVPLEIRIYKSNGPLPKTAANFWNMI